MIDGEIMRDATQKLIAYLNFLGLQIDIRSFDSRVKLQKYAYILGKILGKDLYNDFNFYIKGPYSRILAKEYFENELASANTQYALTEFEKSELERIRGTLHGLNSIQLEIVASLLYLRSKRGYNEQDAEIALKNLKPHLKEEDIWIGSNNVKLLLLDKKKSKEIIAQLENEMKPWEQMSDQETLKFS